MRISILILLFIVSCTSKNDDIKIIGDVKGLPDGKIYLAEARHWQIALDSTMVKDGKFTFHIKADSNFYPYLASLNFHSPKSRTGISTIVYENNNSNGFYLEKGTTKITSALETHNGPNPWANVSTGKENDLFNAFKGQFGGIGKKDDPKRQSRLNFVREQVKKYPYSFFLLDGIYSWQRQYSNAELKSLLQLFDKNVRESRLGSKVYLVTKIRPDNEDHLVNSEILDGRGNKISLIESGKKLNIIIFWASWCKPCREEIPQLKKLYEIIKSNPAISMRSVSLDEDKNMWTKALFEEKMKWKQGIINNSDTETIMTRYNFAAIPYILICDDQLNVINRFVGVDSTTYNGLLSSIDNFTK